MENKRDDAKFAFFPGQGMGGGAPTAKQAREELDQEHHLQREEGVSYSIRRETRNSGPRGRSPPARSLSSRRVQQSPARGRPAALRELDHADEITIEYDVVLDM